METNDLPAFEAMLKERGYRWEGSPMARGRAERAWWKSVKRGEQMLYMLRLFIHDRQAMGMPHTHRYAIVCRLWVPQNAGVACDRIEVTYADAAMDVPTFEERCDMLYRALEVLLPFGKKPVEKHPRNPFLELSIWRDLLVRKHPAPPCPACGEQHQMQLTNSLTVPAHWKCRTCKHAFGQENIPVT